MEYIKFMYVSNEAPDNLIIKDKLRLEICLSKSDWANIL
jgi:hypothetical protein